MKRFVRPFLLILFAGIACIVVIVWAWSRAEGTAGEGVERALVNFFWRDSVSSVDLPDQMNVLLIGVDRRWHSEEMHCDAIHMLHIDLKEEHVEIVNVPRGVYSFIPNQPPQEQYLANVCDYLDVDTFVERVERITGYEADYRVLVGFSQTQALLRAMKFKDPTATLQYLRHRQSYQIGDPQRSFNQAVFIRDTLTSRLDTAVDIPLPMQRALYGLVETDMPFDVGFALLNWAQASALNGDASRVSHRTEPAWIEHAQEIHFDEENAQEQLAQMYDTLRRYYPSFTVTDLQDQVVKLVDERLNEAEEYWRKERYKEVEAIIEEMRQGQIWQQIQASSGRQLALVRLSKLASGLAWIESGNPEQVVEAVSPIVRLLQLEENSEDSVREIQEYLLTLFDTEESM